MMRGKYIVFEGGENVGKTTQVELLAESIEAAKVREPGSTDVGDRIRGLLLDPALPKSSATGVLLNAAQRAELANTKIRPLLMQGIHVVSDRSWVSSAAYQGAEGENYEDIATVNRYALGDLLRPDLLLVLDTEPEEIASRSDGPTDYYEQMSTDFHEDVRRRFLDLGQRLGGVVLDASGTIDEVHSRIRSTVAEKLLI